MHKATCSECGKSCEVPFRPTGDKPVYCNDCFGAKRDNGGDRAPRKDFGGNFGPKRDFADRSPSPINSDIKRQLNDVTMKLDKLISVIERMSSPKEKAAPKSEATQKLELETVIKKAIGSKSEAKPSAKKKVAKKKK
jgi:CxxC-x17-CxxC domain-containing protein